MSKLLGKIKFRASSKTADKRNAIQLEKVTENEITFHKVH